MIDCFIVHPGDITPGDSTAFRSCEILHCMETEIRKVCNTPYRLIMPSCPKSMCRICHYDNSADCPLDLICRTKHLLFILYDREDSVIIARYSSQIYRDDHLCLLCNCFSQFVIVHFQRICLCINQYKFCSHVAYYRCAGRISVCAGDDFITLSYA